METLRQQKVSRLIQKEIGDILRIDFKGKFNNSLITVTKVNITKDLSLARVYISIFSNTKKQETFEEILSSTKEIKFILAKRVKNQLRIMPDIEFFIDDSLDYIEHIDSLLKK